MSKSIPLPSNQRARRGSLLKERMNLLSPAIAFIGDSIIAKFAEEGQPTWDKYFSSLNSGNLGVVGDSTQMVIEKLDRDMLPLEETQTIVLMIGATDLRHKLKVGVVIDQIRKIIMLLQGCRPGIKILILGILPRGDCLVEINEAIKETNELLCTVENGFTIRFLSLESAFFDKGSGKIREELYQKDRINLSPQGYEVLAETIHPVLLECLPDVPPPE